MKHIVHLALLLSFCTTLSLAQVAKLAPPSVSQQREKNDSAEAIVYGEDEVDVKAKRKGDGKAKVRVVINSPIIRFTNDCPAKGEATLRIIVHKSGKVTGVTLVKQSGCSNFDKRVIEDAYKVKYTPALKDGHPVSQETKIDISYVWPRGKN